ncbi:MAG: hypothetical protein LCH93_20395 [Proteobacteria bacterium]|nr:hypothetical protein [Pseudomonadota bacterium]
MSDDDCHRDRNSAEVMEQFAEELGERIQSVVFGEIDGESDYDKAVPSQRRLTWSAARRWFENETVPTAGQVWLARPFYAYTRSWVIFTARVVQRDDVLICLRAVPRHPNLEVPIEFGGVEFEP